MDRCIVHKSGVSDIHESAPSVAVDFRLRRLKDRRRFSDRQNGPKRCAVLHGRRHVGDDEDRRSRVCQKIFSPACSSARCAEAARCAKVYHCGITPTPPEPKLLKTAMGSADYVPIASSGSTLASTLLGSAARGSLTLSAFFTWC